MKYQKGNLRKKSHSSIFANISPRAREIKGKINKWDYLKLKSLCTAKGTIIKMKREMTIEEHICQ